jgi:putative transposase
MGWVVAARVLGLWVEQSEGAKFWLKVFTDLKTRGCQDVLIAVVDGLKGLSQAINSVFPKTTMQTCIVHLMRNSMEFAGWKDRKQIASALRPINTTNAIERLNMQLRKIIKIAGTSQSTK